VELPNRFALLARQALVSGKKTMAKRVGVDPILWRDGRKGKEGMMEDIKSLRKTVIF
jgi:hypothetical protein